MNLVKQLLAIPGAIVLALAHSVAGLVFVLLIGVAIAAVVGSVQFWFAFPLLLPFILPAIALWRLLRSRREEIAAPGETTGVEKK